MPVFLRPVHILRGAFLIATLLFSSAWLLAQDDTGCLSRIFAPLRADAMFVGAAPVNNPCIKPIPLSQSHDHYVHEIPLSNTDDHYLKRIPSLLPNRTETKQEVENRTTSVTLK
jgi:hypothetical protein